MKKSAMKILILSLGAWMLCQTPVLATSTVHLDHVRLETAVEPSAHPGSIVWVAIRQTIAPGWHTYWRNPGDSGLATSVIWDLPQGVKAGEGLWPAPEEFRTGTIVNYGYRDQATILFPLSIGPNVTQLNRRVRIRIFLLECAQMCIPEQSTLDVDLTKASGPPALFEEARAALPKFFHGVTRIAVGMNSLSLTVQGLPLDGVSARSIHVFPATSGIANYDIPAIIRVTGNTLTWQSARALHSHAFEKFEGVVTIQHLGSFAIETKLVSPSVIPPAAAEEITLVGAIAMAFLGGLILNLMPCVLPILSMKALAMASAGESRQQLRRDGIFYFFGVLLAFFTIASILLLLKTGGSLVGWGFQLQSPLAVFVLALLMTAIGLNLLGAFELPNKWMGVGENLTRGHGGQGAFFTGVLAVLVASPCTAPFMGAALGYSLTQPAVPSLLIFMALGTGFALPFSLLAFTPTAIRMIPKPGMWMVRFRQFLAFPMLATSIWLVWVLNQQVGANGLAMALSIALILCVLIWLLPMLPQPVRWISACFGGIALITLSLNIKAATPSPQGNWAPWSAEAVSQAHNKGKTVLVDFSAAWCVTCIVNERIALQNEEVLDRIRRDGVVTLKGDWTNHSDLITQELADHGRSGVPLYLLYPAGVGKHTLLLPQILTPEIVLNALNNAAASQAAGSAN